MSPGASRGPNYRVLRVFAPLLILTGIGGFLLPARLSIMSGAAPYNWFHIGFGALGAWLVLRGREREIGAFNLAFGAMDLYQAAASRAHLFPEAYFQWRPADDAAHVVLGVVLVAVGCRNR